jgi:hypothetical protein
MKNALSVLVAVLVTSTWALGQEQINPNKGVRLGLHASPGVSWLSTSNDSLSADGINFNFQIGEITEIYFAENYAISTGVAIVFNQGGTLASTKSGKFFSNSNLTASDSLSAPFTATYKIQTVEVPFGFKFRSDEVGYLRYYATLPFTFGVHTQGRGNIAAANYTGDRKNITKDINLFNISWGIGGGVEWNLTQKTSMVGGLQFQGGILDISKNKNNTDDTVMRQNAIVLRFGFMF